MTEGIDIEDYRRRFAQAPFVADLGMQLSSIGGGACETWLEIAPRHLQQHGTVHAGVIATLIDHTAGAAATTTVGEGRYVMTAEFKVSLLRPTRGGRLTCRARVLKPGRQVCFVEAEVYGEGEGEGAGEPRLVAKGSATMAVLS